MARRSSHARRCWLGAVLLLFGLTVSPLLATQARASLTYCRSDPVVTLSNGTQVTLYEDISDSTTDVSKITYQLHIPAGATVTSIGYTGAVPANEQTITVSADENLGNYDGYTVVATHTPTINVTAYMSANSNVSTHTNGHSGQTLHSHLHTG